MRLNTNIYVRRTIFCSLFCLTITCFFSFFFYMSISSGRSLKSPEGSLSKEISPSLTLESQTAPPPKAPEFNLSLVNSSNEVSPDYIPENLINVYDKYGASEVWLRDRFVLMNEEAYLAIRELFRALKNSGIDGLYILSAYRSYEKQDQLYKDYINSGGEDSGYTLVQKPGQSEHHTGLAVDLALTDSLAQATNDFGHTPQGKALLEVCHEYGFILRYAEDKKDITGVEYEPWHIRYVGKEHAVFMKEHNMSLEEYIDYLYY